MTAGDHRAMQVRPVLALLPTVGIVAMLGAAAAWYLRDNPFPAGSVGLVIPLLLVSLLVPAAAVSVWLTFPGRARTAAWFVRASGVWLVVVGLYAGWAYARTGQYGGWALAFAAAATLTGVLGVTTASSDRRFLTIRRSAGLMGLTLVASSPGLVLAAPLFLPHAAVLLAIALALREAPATTLPTPAVQPAPNGDLSAP